MIVVCYSRGIKETDEINRYRNKGYGVDIRTYVIDVNLLKTLKGFMTIIKTS
jgi:hypothetical protein